MEETVNTAPIVVNPISDITASIDRPLDFTVAADVFRDDNGDKLQLFASLSSGEALPAWLLFNAETGTFSGIPTERDM